MIIDQQKIIRGACSNSPIKTPRLNQSITKYLEIEFKKTCRNHYFLELNPAFTIPKIKLPRLSRNGTHVPSPFSSKSPTVDHIYHKLYTHMTLCQEGGRLPHENVGGACHLAKDWRQVGLL